MLQINKKSKILSWNKNDGWNSLPTDIPSASRRDLKETPSNGRRGKRVRRGRYTSEKKCAWAKFPFLSRLFFIFFNSFIIFFRFQFNSGWNVLPSESLQLIRTKKTAGVWQIRANKVRNYWRSFFSTNIKGPYILKDGTSKIFSSSLSFFFLFGSRGDRILSALLTFLLARFLIFHRR